MVTASSKPAWLTQLQDSQGYTVRPCIKTKNKNENPTTPITKFHYNKTSPLGSFQQEKV